MSAIELEERRPEKPAAGRPTFIRSDLQLIADMIEPKSRVLDIGCGDGALLDHLVYVKQVIGRGMELSQEGVNLSVSQGLSVVQGDADTDLSDYPDQAFDYVVLSKTLQATRDPRQVLEQLVRIGRFAIVSFPNFGYWKVRLSLLLRGRMPTTRSLPDKWFETENIHLCTIRDFVALSDRCGIRIVKALTIGEKPEASEIRNLTAANVFGQDGVFLLRKEF